MFNIQSTEKLSIFSTLYIGLLVGYLYLTVFPLTFVKYEMADCQRGAQHRAGSVINSYPTTASGILLLLEDVPLVKFIRIYIRDLTGVFSTSSPGRIDDVISRHCIERLPNFAKRRLKDGER